MVTKVKKFSSSPPVPDNTRSRLGVSLDLGTDHHFERFSCREVIHYSGLAASMHYAFPRRLGSWLRPVPSLDL